MQTLFVLFFRNTEFTNVQFAMTTLHIMRMQCSACLGSQTMCAASVSAVGAGCDPGTHLAAAAALAT